MNTIAEPRNQSAIKRASHFMDAAPPAESRLDHTILSTTLCYPDAHHPTRGLFVARRLAAIGRIAPITVVAPRPWYWRGLESAAPDRSQEIGALQVHRPRMWCLPGLWKGRDANAFAAALDGTIDRAVGTERAAVIDAHFEWPDGVGAWQVARRRGLPFVCTLRGKLPSQIVDPTRRRQIRDMLIGADGLIAVSSHLARLACEVAERSLDNRVIPNGVDSSVFFREEDRDAIRERLGWRQDARYVVSVGHWQTLKGFDRLIDVWPTVRRRLGDVRLVLVGGPAGERTYACRLQRRVEVINREYGCHAAQSETQEPCHNQRSEAQKPCHAERSEASQRPAPIERWRSFASLRMTPKRSREALETPRPAQDDIITMTGVIPPDCVASVLNAADLFVSASQSEGWCNAIAEALACGCPVLATDVGGNREQVSADWLGRLVPFGDSEAMADGIAAALSCAWDRRRIAEWGGRRNWEQVARECVEVLAECAAGSGR